MSEENIIERKNPLTVISLMVYGDYEMHDIQQNTAWTSNPYGDSYAVVPDDMVEDILATQGFCDIVLNDDGTEVVSFVAREIPDIPEPEAEPTQLDRIEAAVNKSQQEIIDEYTLELMEGGII